MLRRVVIAGLSTCVLGLAFGFSQTANAVWIDAATGQPIQVEPYKDPNGLRNYDFQSGHATWRGHNLFWDTACNTWKDAATGQEVMVEPYKDPNGLRNYDFQSGHATWRGHNLFWQPCPPPQTASSTGLYLGGELAKNWGRVRSTERIAATDVVSNQFTDSGDPLGAGIVAGYNFSPWNNNIKLGPFASFDFLNQTINHNGAGFLLGTTTHWIATLGAKGGYVVTPSVYLYGLAGASWLNQTLNVNFATAALSNTTTPGFTLGLGGEYQPSSWRLFGHPVSVFAQYQHTWWSNANFNTPTSSAGFNYAFKREDDTIRLGVNVYLWH